MEIAGKEKRRSGLELLRIIAMLLIVFGHFCGQSDVMGFIEPHSATAVIVAILGNASRVSVNLFLIVAVWFMVGRDFKAERLIKTWVTVFLWGVYRHLSRVFAVQNLELSRFFSVFSRYWVAHYGLHQHI